MGKSIGVIFDMDGVIVHSNPTHKKAIQKFLKERNQSVSDAYLENNVYGCPNKEWMPKLFGKEDPDKLERLADEKEQLFRDIFVPEDNVVEGIHDFLEQLGKRNIPMAVATSAPGENADYILSRLAILKYFTAVLDSSDINKGKPNPEVYIKAAKLLNKRPEECIVIEDSISGVKAGLNAGATVIGVTTTHTAEELSNCHLTIKNFRELDPDNLVNWVLEKQK